MKISIITVVFNGEKTIEQTILSVLSQDYPNIEYIVIDGGSRDNTNTIIRNYKDRIAVYISEADKGLYDAMNKGIRHATGDYVGILNADDFYVDHTVISKVASQLKATNCEGIYGDLDYVDPVQTEKILRKWKAGRYKPKSFLFGWMPPHPTFFVRKDVYDRYGTFNLTLRSAADYEIMLRFIHKHGIQLSYLPETLVKMRAGGVSNAGLKSRITAYKEDHKAWELNDLRPYFFTGLVKKIRKIPQFFQR